MSFKLDILPGPLDIQSSFSIHGSIAIEAPILSGVLLKGSRASTRSKAITWTRRLVVLSRNDKGQATLYLHPAAAVASSILPKPIDHINAFNCFGYFSSTYNAFVLEVLGTRSQSENHQHNSAKWTLKCASQEEMDCWIASIKQQQPIATLVSGRLQCRTPDQLDDFEEDRLSIESTSNLFSAAGSSNSSTNPSQKFLENLDAVFGAALPVEVVGVEELSPGTRQRSTSMGVKDGSKKGLLNRSWSLKLPSELSKQNTAESADSFHREKDRSFLIYFRVV
ncbi:hypothetical protein BDR26DRAFT_853795, partial [Obelidium mucronatum]